MKTFFAEYFMYSNKKRQDQGSDHPQGVEGV